MEEQQAVKAPRRRRSHSAVGRRTRKTGAPPGTLISAAEATVKPLRISVLDYSGSGLEEKELANVEEAFVYRDRESVTWINIEGLHDAVAVEKLGLHYGLHPLLMEDILTTSQRPKLETNPEHAFIVLKMIWPGQEGEVLWEQIAVVAGRNWLLTFQEGVGGDVLNSVRQRIRDPRSRLRRLGPDYLAYCIIDSIIDYYFVVLEKLGEELEDLEGTVLAAPGEEALRNVYRVKKELLHLRRSIWPVREVISGLEREDEGLIGASTKTYLKDAYDHIVQAVEICELYRETSSGLVDVYLSSINNRLNVVMKVLAAIATVFMHLTFIAGIYGMNFKYMPELSWYAGYPLTLLLMLAVAVVMIIYFRKRKWL